MKKLTGRIPGDAVIVPIYIQQLRHDPTRYGVSCGAPFQHFDSYTAESLEEANELAKWLVFRVRLPGYRGEIEVVK